MNVYIEMDADKIPTTMEKLEKVHRIQQVRLWLFLLAIPLSNFFGPLMWLLKHGSKLEMNPLAGIALFFAACIALIGPEKNKTELTWQERIDRFVEFVGFVFVFSLAFVGVIYL